MLDRLFKLKEHGANVRTELLAGLTTFLTMAYIIFLQPAILSGQLFGIETGMDWGAVMTATCLAAALATAIMGLYANYPIGQAPGMGENFFFVFSVLPAAATVATGATQSWQIALGAVFIAGMLFLLLAVLGVREAMLGAISPSMRNAIAVGIGVFVAFFGLQNAGLIAPHSKTCVKLNPYFTSPDVFVFVFGLVVIGIPVYLLNRRWVGIGIPCVSGREAGKRTISRAKAAADPAGVCVSGLLLLPTPRSGVVLKRYSHVSHSIRDWIILSFLELR